MKSRDCTVILEGLEKMMCRLSGQSAAAQRPPPTLALPHASTRATAEQHPPAKAATRPRRRRADHSCVTQQLTLAASGEPLP